MSEWDKSNLTPENTQNDGNILKDDFKNLKVIIENVKNWRPAKFWKAKRRANILKTFQFTTKCHTFTGKDPQTPFFLRRGRAPKTPLRFLSKSNIHPFSNSISTPLWWRKDGSLLSARYGVEGLCSAPCAVQGHRLTHSCVIVSPSVKSYSNVIIWGE